MPRLRRKVRTLTGDLAFCSILVAAIALMTGAQNPWAPVTLLAVLPCSFYLTGLYDLEPDPLGVPLIVQSLVACAMTGMTVATLDFLLEPFVISRRLAVGALGSVGLLLPLSRRWIDHLALQTGERRVPVLVLGGEGHEHRLAELLQGHRLFELRNHVSPLLGRYTEHALERFADEPWNGNGRANGNGNGNGNGHHYGAGGTAVATIEAAPPWTMRALDGARTVVVADPRQLPQVDFQQLVELRLRGIHVIGLPEFWEEADGRLPVFDLTDEWLAIHSGILRDDHSQAARLKRATDVVGATLLLLLLAIPTAVAALATWLNDPGPILFRQGRVGKDGKPFQVIKLRTMHRDADQTGPAWTEERDRRITRVGAFVRKTRLDEVPQLVNVLRGEMSLVGPRPEAESLSHRYAREIPHYELRYLAKPGVTGWAQVRFRNTCTVEDAATKLEYDLYYVRRRSLGLDVRILMKTVSVVLFGRGR